MHLEDFRPRRRTVIVVAGLGKTIFDYNSEVVRSHQDDWAKLLRWLKKLG